MRDGFIPYGTYVIERLTDITILFYIQAFFIHKSLSWNLFTKILLVSILLRENTLGIQTVYANETEWNH